MSDARRFWAIVAAACGSLAVWPDTQSWLVFAARPCAVLAALCALAPWRDDA